MFRHNCGGVNTGVAWRANIHWQRWQSVIFVNWFAFSFSTIKILYVSMPCIFYFFNFWLINFSLLFEKKNKKRTSQLLTSNYKRPDQIQKSKAKLNSKLSDSTSVFTQYHGIYRRMIFFNKCLLPCQAKVLQKSRFTGNYFKKGIMLVLIPL